MWSSPFKSFPSKGLGKNLDEIKIDRDSFEKQKNRTDLLTLAEEHKTVQARGTFPIFSRIYIIVEVEEKFVNDSVLLGFGPLPTSSSTCSSANELLLHGITVLKSVFVTFA
ncbi:MAG: hypothetical protein JSW15_10660 [Deltaproteobacteria bacterium]|nr:MAG: hypothetical protein JSW15_10660 [Deltaproteobacteria bacterium]